MFHLETSNPPGASFTNPGRWRATELDNGARANHRAVVVRNGSSLTLPSPRQGSHFSEEPHGASPWPSLRKASICARTSSAWALDSSIST